ncbi:MAG: hypothetical protein ACRDDX_04715 [Cellulosilyticaceae bacterium]
MGLVGALILFVIFIVVYMMIAEIFTVLFRLTGLTQEKARFQVISMLTNSGYTTAESELITSSKIRRRLARMTMLFGYSFTVTIVSIIVNIFISLSRSQIQSIWGIFFIIFPAIVIIYVVLRFTGIRKAFDHFIQRMGNKMMFGEGSNPIMVLDTYGESVMAEIQMNYVPYFLEKIPLEKSGLKAQYQVQIVLIKRSGEMLTTVTGDTCILEEDIVVVFGKYKTIRQLFERPLEVVE